MLSLTETEKEIVFKIFIHGNSSINVLENASAISLKDQRIIYHASMGNSYAGFSCGLNPMAREFLNENPNYLVEYAKLMKNKLQKECEKLEVVPAEPFNVSYDAWLVKDKVK